VTLIDELAPMVLRNTADHRNDRQRIAAAFRKLRKLGYVTRMSVKDSPVENYDTPNVFWYVDQDSRAFGSGELRSGDIQGTLWLHWQGNIAKIVEALETEGLRVVVSEQLSGPLSVLPMPTNPHYYVTKPGAIESRDYRRGCWVCGATADHSVRTMLRSRSRDRHLLRHKT
jgi:hypothetical protein